MLSLEAWTDAMHRADSNEGMDVPRGVRRARYSEVLVRESRVE